MAITSRVGWRTSYRRAPTLAPVPMPSGTVEPANICPMACLPIRPQGEGVAHPLWPRKWRQALRLNEGACPYRWQRVHVYTRSHRAGAKSKMVFAHHSNSPNPDQPKPLCPPMQTARCMVFVDSLDKKYSSALSLPPCRASERWVVDGWRYTCLRGKRGPLHRGPARFWWHLGACLRGIPHRPALSPKLHPGLPDGAKACTHAFAVEVVYRCDSVAHFHSRTGSAGIVDTHKRALQKQYEKARKEAQSAGLLPVRTSGGLLPLQNLILDHFRHALRPGHMYELTALASKLLRSVGETLSGLHHHAAPAEPLEPEAPGPEEEGDGPEAPGPEDDGVGDGEPGDGGGGTTPEGPWDGGGGTTPDVEPGDRGGGTTPEYEPEQGESPLPAPPPLAPPLPPPDQSPQSPPPPPEELALDHDMPMVLEDDTYH